MDYAKCADLELVSIVLGVSPTKLLGSEDVPILNLFYEKTYAESHSKLQAAGELLKRGFYQKLVRGDVLKNAAAATNFLRTHFACREHEAFYVLFLNTQFNLIKGEEMFRGSVAQTYVYPREIAKTALELNASSVILAHNHPSNCLDISKADISLTKQIKETLSLIDIQVSDHIIVTTDSYVSMAEKGML